MRKQVTVKQELSINKGQCDFCQEENVKGIAGVGMVDRPITEIKMTVSKYKYNWNVSKLIAKDKGYAFEQVITGWEKRAVNPLICFECIKDIYKEIK